MPEIAVPTVYDAATGELTRAIKYGDIMGTDVDLDSQHIIGYDCYQADKYKVVGKFKRTKDGEKPTLVAVSDQVGQEFSITKRDPNDVGVLMPKKRGVTRKSIEEYRLDKHIVDPNNSCIERDEEYGIRKIEALERLKKFDTGKVEEEKRREEREKR